jgi:tetratricopeptide (TPR) repeat protein
MAAYVAPDAIPRSLFAVLVEGEGPRQRKALADAFGSLHRFSLAEVSGDSISVHRLVQKVVRDGAEARSDSTRPLAALKALCETFPRDPALPAGWPVCEQLLAHVLAIGDRWASHWGESEAMVGILHLACEYLLHLADAGRVVATARVVTRVADALLGPEHLDTLWARGNLARAYRSVGRTAQAIPIQQEVLADSERTLGPEHLDTITARGNLARAYRSIGRIAQAIPIQQEVLADSERTLGPEHPDTITARGNLAGSYRFAGRYADAIPIDEAVVADRERILGPEHPDTLWARANLGRGFGSWATVAQVPA